MKTTKKTKPTAKAKPAQKKQETNEVELDLKLLHENPWNQARPVDEELIASIKADGLIHAVLVRPHPKKAGHFEIVCGARRTGAVKKAGLKTIRAIVREMDDTKAKRLTLAENTHRQNLTPWQEAEAVRVMLDGADPEEAAAALGWSRSKVLRRAKLLEMTEGWQAAVNDGVAKLMSAAHLELVAVLPVETQTALLEKVENECYDSVYTGTLDELKEMISENFEHNLTAAPFNPKDAALCPSVGSCLDCTKRTGATPDLFEEATGQNLKANDTCLDPTCWGGKVSAAEKAKTDALREKHGDKLRFVSPAWYIDAELKREFPGVLHKGRYEKVKKGAEGAEPAMIVDGTDKGKVIQIVVKEEKVTVTDKDGLMQTVSKEEAKAIKAEAALSVRRKALIAEGIDMKLEAFDPARVDLELLVTLAVLFGVNNVGNDWDAVGDIRDNLKKALWDALMHSLQIAQRRNHEDGVEICKALGIGLDDVMEQVEKTLAQPTKKPRKMKVEADDSEDEGGED